MMTKKCYAAIMSAKDMSAKIKELTDEVKEKGVTKAYKAIMAIAEMNDKYVADFASVDPAWSPEPKKEKAESKSEEPAQAQTQTQPQAQAPAHAYAYDEELPIQ